MSNKIRRNDPCPCGSGKKYKKCCMNKGGLGNVNFEMPMDMFPFVQPPGEYTSRTIEYMNTHDAAEILNLIVALQLNPENKGANIRMERLARYAVLTMHKGNQPVNFQELKEILNNEFVVDYLEDPPTNLHSETFVWVGGNHTIYPGIATNASEILNLMNGVLWLAEAHWPETFMRNVYQAFALILSLGDLMAERAHIKGYIKGGNRQRKPLVYLNSNTDFGISEALMRGILFQRGVSRDVLDAFVLDAEKERDALLDEEVSDKNPLLRKPIVKYKDKYYFLLITNQVDALRHYVLDQANKYGCLNQLMENCYDYLWQQLLEVFYKMLWRPVNIDPGEKALSNTYERIFQFDRNCYAYVCFVHDEAAHYAKDDAPFFDVTEHVLRVEEKILNQVGQDKHYMSIVLFASMGETSGCTMSKESIHPVLLWPAHVFVALSKMEKWERLDLFHYANANAKVAKRMFSAEPLDVYAIYKTKGHSFYLSDDKQADWIVPTPDEGYELIQESKLAINYHAVERIHEGKDVYVAVVRESEDVQIYQPINQDDTYLRCIDNGAVPIWVSCEQEGIFTHQAAVWGTAVLYWIHYINEYEDISRYLPQRPQEIRMHFTNKSEKKPYKIAPITNGARIVLANNAVEFMLRPNNEGERELMKDCLNALLGNNKGADLVDKYIPLSEAKMFISYSIDPLSMSNPVGHLEPLLLTEASQQRVCEELPIWMAENGKDFSGELTSKDAKVQALQDIVTVCLAKVKQIVAEYDYKFLLRMAVWHYDSLIWKREHDKVHNPAQLLCFGRNEDRMLDIRKSELRLTRSGLGLRCLIEFLASQPYEGGIKEIGDYELEYLATIMCEVVTYGSCCDMVMFDIADMRVGHLPSGRFGINQDEFEEKLSAFQIAYNEENVDGLVRMFPEVFKEKKQGEQKKEDKFLKKMDDAFRVDWGLSFQELGRVCFYMSQMCLNRKLSTLQVPEDMVIKEVCKVSGYDESIARTAINRLALQARPSYLTAPEGYKGNEVYPWRYNREFSFIRRFIVKEKDSNGEVYLTFGQRNALAAFQQLVLLLTEGQLSVPEHEKHVKAIVGHYSEEKGTEFNEQVRNYLREHTMLMVVDYDLKIDPRHFKSADRNYGDIDVLAFDRESGVLYNIECKDTVMAKNIYQMYLEIRKYLGLNEDEKKDALIWKHYHRHEWLCEHKQEMANYLRVAEVRDVKSIVVTSTVLPVTYLKGNESPLPIVSYRDMVMADGDMGTLCGR